MLFRPQLVLEALLIVIFTHITVNHRISEYQHNGNVTEKDFFYPSQNSSCADIMITINDRLLCKSLNLLAQQFGA